MDNRGARLTRRDVTELATASEQLAVVAEQIRGSGVRWGELAVNLIIAVNNTVVRIQNKGAAAFARYLEKNQPAAAQEAQAEVKPGEDANLAPKSVADEPED